MSKNILYGIISGIIVFLVLGIPTALLPTGLYDRMIQVIVFDYIFLFVVPVLFGIFISTYLKSRKTKKRTCAAAGGVISGWLAVICPICTTFLVYIFGASVLLTYFDPIRPVFGVISIGLLGALIYLQKQNITKKPFN